MSSTPTNSLSANPLSKDSEKKTADFGLRVVKSCYERWRNGYGNESWVQRVQRYERNRAYASGKQPTSQYRDIVKVEGQIAVVNLDYSPLPIAIPFLNRLKDRYMQRDEKIRCSAIDPFTQSKKKRAKEAERFKMNHSGDIQSIQQSAGVELEEFSEDDPKTPQELDIKYGFNYKETEEILMELGIDMVFNENNWWDVPKDAILNDIMNCGFAVVDTEVNGSGRIITPTVKPENFITSYSEFTDFNDWQWQGQKKAMSILEIRLLYPGKISEEDLFNLAQRFVGKMGNGGDWSYSWTADYNTAIARPYDGFNVEVVELYYKTLNNITYEKKQNSFGREILKKTDKVVPAKEYEKSNPYYVAYRGVWVIDTDYLLEWGISKRMLKPNNNLTEVYSPYAIFMHNNNKCNNTPLVETMISCIDMMQLLHLQTQKIIAMTAPDGYDIDLTGISEVDLGAGVGVVSPMQLFDIYLQTGNQYYIGKDLGDGETRQQPPITPKTHQYSNKLEQLDNKWQREYQKLQILIGSNNLDSGTITNQAVANKTLQDAREISENTSNYVYTAYLNIFKRVARNVMMRLWDKLVYEEGEYDGYAVALGMENVEYIKIEATEGFEKSLFDITVDAVIDDNEKVKLDNRIDIALTNKEITLQDAVELDLIKNLKFKAYLLASRAKKKREQDMQDAKANTQNNLEQANAAAKTKADGDLAVEKQSHANKLEQLKEEQSGEAQKQAYQFSSLVRGKVVDGVLAKPGATINDIPSFIWEALGVTEEAQKQIMLSALQDMSAEKAAAQQQAQMEQLQAAQQQQMQQPGQDVQQPEQMQQVA